MQIQDLTVVSVDPHDEPAFRAWFDAFTAGIVAGRIDPPTATWAEILIDYQRPSTSYRREAFAAVADGTTVGAGSLDLPLRENPRLAMFDVAVPPDHRGRGIGAALAAYAEKRAVAAGRSSLLIELTVPDGTPNDQWPGTGFLSRRGFTLRNTEIRRQLRLPVEPSHLKALAAKAAERASAYRLVSWAGPCPAEYAEQYALLKGLLSVEAPMGDLDYEQEVWDVARLRDEEERSDAQGRSRYTTIALTPDGELAGHTQLAVSRHEPDRGFQWDTLVLTAHRGHRLGLALKVANLQTMTAAHPEVGRIETWNAVQNGPMVKVNVELGFEIVESLQEWQRDL